jgi:hypothetical protein
MKYDVLAVTRKEVEEGDNKGKAYFVVEAKDPDPMVTRSINFPVFPESEAVIEWWEETAAKFEAGDKSRLKAINVGRYSVGDTDINPNSEPLPAFQLMNSKTKEYGAVSTSMTVHVLLDSDGKPRVSPRKEAMRIIANIGRFVDSHVSQEPQADTEPPV